MHSGIDFSEFLPIVCILSDRSVKNRQPPLRTQSRISRSPRKSLHMSIANFSILQIIQCIKTTKIITQAYPAFRSLQPGNSAPKCSILPGNLQGITHILFSHVRSVIHCTGYRAYCIAKLLMLKLDKRQLCHSLHPHTRLSFAAKSTEALEVHSLLKVTTWQAWGF